MPKKMDINWFHSWLPLSKCPLPVENVDSGVYKVAEQCYVFTVPYNKDCVEDKLAPYITMLIFAGSDGAVKRSLLTKLEDDDGASLDFEMLEATGIANCKYGALSKLNGVFESAKYNGSSGQFIEVQLRHEDKEYCFRENKLKDTSRPYCIKLQSRA